jgi:DNA-directed RNA polymerase subunit RPC12/RpoP
MGGISMTKNTEDQSVHFSITFALDKDEFLRRTCPRCGRSFKTLTDPSDLASILQPAFKRIENEIGGITLSTDQEQELQYLSCPYCNHRAESGDMLTYAFQAYLKRFVVREYVLPQINKMFSDFADGLPSTSRSNSFMSLEVKVDFDNVLPPRPISGPEPPDMTKIELLCCGKMIKVYDNWFDLDECPFCGIKVRLI